MLSITSGDRVNPCQGVLFLVRCRSMDEKILPASFYQNSLGAETVRDWLKDLDRDDRLIIGGEIKTVEFGWPIGMPTCKPLGKGLYEVRSNYWVIASLVSSSVSMMSGWYCYTHLSRKLKKHRNET
jgi:hypothetical protein